MTRVSTDYHLSYSCSGGRSLPRPVPRCEPGISHNPPSLTSDDIETDVPKNDQSCHQSQDFMILSLINILLLLLASFLPPEGEEKEQDIFAGQSSRKQRKQGLEYLKTKTPKKTSKFCAHLESTSDAGSEGWNPSGV